MMNAAAGDKGETIVPIIGGTGALGFGLALSFARAGLGVAIGSRDEERAVEAADRAKGDIPEARIDGFSNEEAAGKGDIVFLAVPFRAQSETLTNLRDHLRPDQILVDCTVPLAAAVAGKATRLLGVWQGSAAEQAQEMVPEGVTVVSALHTVSAKALAEGERFDEDTLICGDRKADKARVVELIEHIPGLRAVNAGSLETSRITESLTPLLISINTRYKTHSGIKITGLPEGDHWG